MDFAAFAREASAPQPPERFEDLSRVELYCFAEITAELPPATSDLNLDRIPGTRVYQLRDIPQRPRRRFERHRFAHHWTHRARRSRPVMQDGRKEHFASLFLCPLALWHHLPLTMANRMSLADETLALGDRHAGVPVLNAARPGLQRQDDGSLTARLLAPPPTFFETIVRGLLWEIGWFGSPDGRDSEVADLKARADGMEADAQLTPEDILAREMQIALDDVMEQSAFQREPFDERDRGLLALVQAAEAERPGSVRFPCGRPDA
jgi:hypothetical protein